MARAILDIPSMPQNCYECPMRRMYRRKWFCQIIMHVAFLDQRRPERYRFVSDAKAREWLLANGEDEAAERYFGEIEEERGPGRPEIGPPFMVRLPAELSEQLEQRAEADGVPKAEVVRRMLTEALQVYHLDEDWDAFEPALRAELEKLSASKEEADKVASRARELATTVWDVGRYAAEELELLRDVARYAAKELKLLRE